PSRCARLPVSFHSNTLTPPPPPPPKPGPPWPQSARPPTAHPPAGLRPPPVFCNHRLQHVLVQTQVRHQLAQPRVLVPQLLRLLRLAHIHPAVLRFPGVDGVLRHTYFPRHVFCLTPCLHLFHPSHHL